MNLFLNNLELLNRFPWNLILIINEFIYLYYFPKYALFKSNAFIDFG